MLTDHQLAKEIAGLVEVAVASQSQDEYRGAALERLQLLIGFDSAVFSSPRSPSLVTVNKALPMRDAYLSRRDRYAQELAALGRAASQCGGTLIPEDAIPIRERSRLKFFEEIVRPQHIRSILLGAVTLPRSSARSSRIFLARHGGMTFRFGPGESQRLARLLPVLALGDGLERRSRLTSFTQDARDRLKLDWTTLTPRELELLDYVARGWRNAEIAMAFGTSPFTVRNQLAGLFRKCGATTRAELVGMAVDSGVIALRVEEQNGADASSDPKAHTPK